MKCPKCKQTTHQRKCGTTKAGSQQYSCKHCKAKYTPDPKGRGYPDELRMQAIRVYVDGINYRRIGRLLKVHHTSVINWVKAFAAQLPTAPLPEELHTIELDELFTFIETKKKRIYLVTAVERKTRCIVGWSVMWEQSREAFQAVVDQAPHGMQYYSDHNPIYPALVYYPGKLTLSDGKSETYSVEGLNAEFRHYLARLVRRSRCFSRCPSALECAIKLYVFCHNSRQLYKHKYPNYASHIIDFLPA